MDLWAFSCSSYFESVVPFVERETMVTRILARMYPAVLHYHLSFINILQHHRYVCCPALKNDRIAPEFSSDMPAMRHQCCTAESVLPVAKLSAIARINSVVMVVPRSSISPLLSAGTCKNSTGLAVISPPCIFPEHRPVCARLLK